MRSRLRTLTLTSLVALGGLVTAGAENAKAQLIVTTPGVSVGLGTPYAAYPSYAPVVPLTPVYRPIPVRPLPYVYGRPGFYGSRQFGPRPYYGPRGGNRGWYGGGGRRW
ncbi:hypothetical protein SAMN05444166_4601 [Singulisphaera sp. GP187]|uniref:hypothetical protein n=1 Tax=Singulisphaera sp. GP187 TaxID=1882752 RepID=UPI00092AC098|nr:hypothetical protein [Singulisphaera sp. GP187]SIO42500.1 hypothetical protein SAMN05444166_4601 [Singulisphaera sp. GP187]